MKAISELLNKIEKEEKIIEKMGKFLKTKRGRMFVMELSNRPLVDLCNKYKAPKFILYYKAIWKNKNLLMAAIKKYNIEIPEYKPIHIETIKTPKCRIYLKRKELAQMNAKYTKRLGFAALMHEREEHKVRMFEKRHPGPTEKELKEDLFPEELITQRATQMWLYREYTRNFLCKLYTTKNIREKYYRLFCVYENKTSRGIYEKEGDPMVVGYPFTRYNEKTDINTLKQVLRDRAKTIRDSEVRELKLYNKYGKLIASVAVR